MLLRFNKSKFCSDGRYVKQGIGRFDDLSNLIFHSDQGWQYQMAQYHKALKERGITQSMSRKGNCLDNSPMENFFGKMKNEMFYGHEYEFKTLEQLQDAMENTLNTTITKEFRSN